MDLTEQIRSWTLLFILSCCLPCLVCGDTGQPWRREWFKQETEGTFELVFHQYHRWVRPPEPYVNVTVKMSVQRINFLDVLRQKLETVIGMEIIWFDSRLALPSTVVDQIMANASSVWTPDLVFLNSVSPTQSLLPPIVRIKKDGMVAWTTREVVTTSCSAKPGSVKQTCHIRLGFMSNIRKIQGDRFIQHDTSSVDTPGELRSNEWDLKSISLDFVTGEGSLPLEMDVEMSMNQLDTNARGRRCLKSSANTADHSQRLFTQMQNGSALLMLIGLLWLVHI